MSPHLNVRSLVGILANDTMSKKEETTNTLHEVALASFCENFCQKATKWIGAAILSKAIIIFEIFEKKKSPTKQGFLLLGSLDLDCQIAVGFFILLFILLPVLYSHLMLDPSLDAKSMTQHQEFEK